MIHSPLQYLLREPANQPAPVVVMLHGYGSNEHDLFSMAPQLGNRSWIISLRAPRQLFWGGYCWYEIDFEASGSLRTNEAQALESLELIEQFLEEMPAAHPGMDKQNVNLMGFSQGAILSQALAFRHPERYKSVMALSGYVHEALLPPTLPAPQNFPALFMTHGRQDATIPVEMARQSDAFLNQNGIVHDYREYEMGHGVDASAFRDLRDWMTGRELI